MTAIETSKFWQSYLAPNPQRQHLCEQMSSCRAAFVDHKNNIADLVRLLSPSTVAILGSGHLNDIPLSDLVADQRKVYLVDWIDDVSAVGVSNSIISQDQADRPRCLFCTQTTAGLDYCKNFTGQVLDEGVCSSFEQTSSPFLTCKNYEPAAEPIFMKADITGGLAPSFAAKMADAIASCKNVRAAFVRAIAIAGRFDHCPLPIDDHSVDLVTSSMVISQFDVEPYTYFSKLLEKKFSHDEIFRDEDKITPLMQQLRTKLFTLQVESHLKEMHRILKNNGQSKAYLSAELFRSYPDGKQFFLVQDMPKAIELIARYFTYDFDILPDRDILTRTAMGSGISVNQSYVLTPKSKIDSN